MVASPLLVDCVPLSLASTKEGKDHVALAMLHRQARRGIRPRTLAADKGYHCWDFIQQLRTRQIRPPIAQITGRHTPGLDARTTRHGTYALGQRIRKRVEEIFGWVKTIGGLRRSRFRGVARTQQAAYFIGATYNLLRLSRLSAQLSTP